MKRIIGGVLILGLLMGISACNGGASGNITTTGGATDKVLPLTPENKKVLDETTDPNKLTELGVASLEGGDYQMALAAFQKIVSMETTKDTEANAYYNLACTYSLMKDKDNSLKALAAAIRNGYDSIENRDWMEQDKDLTYLRTFPEYQEVLKMIPPLQEVTPTAEDDKQEAEAVALIEKEHGLKFKEMPKYKILAPGQFRRLGRDDASTQGLYRWDNKTLYLKQGLDPARAKGTRIHETFHALQDQLFDMGALQKSAKTTDEFYTVKAVIEGDATLIFIECMTPTRAAVMITSATPWRMMGAEPVYDESQNQNSEVAMRMNAFDYSTAARFIKAVKNAKGWDGVNQIYHNLPKSTSEILHPDKYLSGEFTPVAVTIPSLEKVLGPDWQISAPNTIGEFFILLDLLTNPQSGPKAEEYTAGWAGDTQIRCVNPAQKLAFVVWKSVWETPEKAAQYAEGSRQVLDARLAHRIAPTTVGENLWRYDYMNSVSAVYVNDKSVTLIQDCPKELFEAVLGPLK